MYHVGLVIIVIRMLTQSQEKHNYTDRISSTFWVTPVCNFFPIMIRSACRFVVQEKAKPGIGGYKLCVQSKDFTFIPQM